MGAIQFTQAKDYLKVPTLQQVELLATLYQSFVLTTYLNFADSRHLKFNNHNRMMIFQIKLLKRKYMKSEEK